MKPRIAVLASGNGSTAEAVIRACASGAVNYEVGLVISSREQAGIVERIKNLNAELNLNIACVVINSQTHPAEPNEIVERGAQTKAEETAMLKLLQDGHFALVASLGYMKRLGPNIVTNFGWLPSHTSIFQTRMINTHPGLLPETQALHGINIQSYTLDRGLKQAGQSMHVVAEDYDTGPVIYEHQVAVEPDDTPETLFARVQAIEKLYLPMDIDTFISGRQAYLSAQEAKKEQVNV